MFSLSGWLPCQSSFSQCYVIIHASDQIIVFLLTRGTHRFRIEEFHTRRRTLNCWMQNLLIKGFWQRTRSNIVSIKIFVLFDYIYFSDYHESWYILIYLHSQFQNRSDKFSNIVLFLIKTRYCRYDCIAQVGLAWDLSRMNGVTCLMWKTG